MGKDLLPTPAGRVVVISQPTAQGVSSAVRSQAIINKVLIKAFVKGSKKDLPPYSPDLNPGGVFSQVKSIMKQNSKVFETCSAPRALAPSYDFFI